MTSVYSKRPERFVETALDDEIVLMDLESAEVFSLNETGRAVWNRLDGMHDRDELVAELARDYAVAPELIADEIGQLLDGLADAGFISCG